MVIALIAFFGLALGSFVNALVWRLHEQARYLHDNGTLKRLTAKDKTRLEQLSIVRGRSMCSHCGHALGTADLIPVVSWLALGGKCRYCRRPIPDTPVAELVTAFTLVVSYLFWPYATGGWQVLDIILFSIWSLIVTCFVALAIYDAKWYLLPDRIVWPLTGIATVFVLLQVFDTGSTAPLIGASVGALVISGTFWALSKVSKGAWIGFGDVKLGLSLGMLAGGALMGWLVIFIASVLGTLMTLPQVFKSGGVKRMLPFGPYLIIATVIVVLFGSGIFDWYVGLIAP